MSTFRNLAVTALAGLACSGCTYWQNQAESLYKGQALIADNVYLLKEKDKANPAYDARSEDLPTPCSQNGIDSWTGAANADQIRKCTYAMMLLIDVRWAHFSDAVHGTVTYGNATLDTASVGLNTAGTLATGGTSQILNAAAAGLGAFKATLNQDILYKNSIELILLQMRTNRSAAANTIVARLGTPFGYRNMYEAAVDLYIYARAGSWTEALASLQTDTSIRQRVCDIQLMYTKLNSDGTVTAPEGADKDSVLGRTNTLLATSNNRDALLNDCAVYKQYKLAAASDANAQPVKVTFIRGSEFNEKAAGEIKKVADTFKKGGYAKILVQGETDSSGKPDANKELGKARAKEVAKELARLGIAENVIDTSEEPKPNGERAATITLKKAAP
ncbi:OmpA family protein [Rhizomicrobium electricum]|uniref:OmpA-like domain-containing protein n=1 Tax=Rhizomicrobium electricum TaxID=480070 RepID=A0ABP3PIZ6_9PROT|nr:OmpA family protein [Rhizomicrobium electricum]NIJ48379.1 outer membrane protein OmpA-like peptidoglycan-associated protein [Rhizomicrobium electricum]